MGQRTDLRGDGVDMNIQLVIDGCAVWSNEMAEANQVKEPEMGKVTEADEAVKHFKAIQELQQEAFAVLAFDGALKPKGPARIVTLGLLDSNQVHPREVFADALKDRASAIMVAHNHPSGTLESSVEDRAITKRICAAGQILGIRVLDHIILTPGGGWMSMCQKGEMPSIQLTDAYRESWEMTS